MKAFFPQSSLFGLTNRENCVNFHMRGAIPSVLKCQTCLRPSMSFHIRNNRPSRPTQVFPHLTPSWHLPGHRNYFMWTQEMLHLDTGSPSSLETLFTSSCPTEKILLNNPYYPSHIIFKQTLRECSPNSANGSKPLSARTGQKASPQMVGLSHTTDQAN